MQMVAEKFQTKVRTRLEEEQTTILQKLEDLTRCRGALERVPEPLIGDEADMAVLSIEQRLEYLELRRIISSVRAIEAALLTMEHGRYGICLRCDKTIPSNRLQALPTAILCRDCQEAVEEESLAGCRA